MEKKKIVVLVEEVEAARTALLWALNNLLRYGDSVILLHVFPSSSSISNKNISKKKQRFLRLKGFHLALSFNDLCHTFPDAKVEIVVTQGDQDGNTIASVVRDTGASALVVGLHDHSFLHKMATTGTRITDNPNCKVLAIKQSMTSPSDLHNSMNNLVFSQIETAKLSTSSSSPAPTPAPQRKIRYQILPSPFGIIWRGRSRRISSTSKY